MSTYRKIHGRSIQAVTTDPTGDVAEGQVWYNTTSDTFKSIVASEAWASSAPLTTTASKGDLFTFRYNGSKWLEVGRNQALTLS